MSRKRKLEELVEIYTAISSRLQSRDLLKSIALSALALLNADSAEIWLQDRRGGRPRFRLLASAGTSDPARATGRRGAPVLVLSPDMIAEQDGRLFVNKDLGPALRKALPAFQGGGFRATRCEAAFFEIGEKDRGLLTVTREADLAFDEEDYYFLEKLAIQTGISLGITRRFEQIVGERDQALNAIEAMRGSRAGTVVGASPAIREVQRLIDLAGPSRARVLILGERGVGKELVADLLHRKSDLRDAPLIKLNCAGLVETLLESELFGYERGAFTGADETRTGLLEQAEGGTLFLDEVGEMSPAMQAKLLRFLQDGSFRRVGGKREIKVGVRILAATNRGIDNEAERDDAGTQLMRRDLYDRLATVILRIPPLRERREDIAPLMQFFLKRFCALENKRHILGFAPEVIARMEAADWPGNVRELENAVHRLVILHGEGSMIDNLEHVFVASPAGAPRDASPADLAGAGPETQHVDATAKAPEAGDGETASSYFQAKDRFEAAYIRAALRAARGNISRAARDSGLDRGNFKLKMQKHGIDAGEFRKPRE